MKKTKPKFKGIEYSLRYFDDDSLPESEEAYIAEMMYKAVKVCMSIHTTSPDEAIDHFDDFAMAMIQYSKYKAMMSK
jgi:hypothetical protein